MNILVTGHRGYIGVHLVEQLRAAGHGVTGVDLGLFADCAWEPFAAPDRELSIDVRALTPADLAGHDAVLHLAAISNDPMGELNPALTLSVNRDGSIHVARVAKAAGVPRFLFAGSCSIYGASLDRPVVETDALNPLTAYARSKIEAEQGIAALADAAFCPVFLRSATAYGFSPMLRIDLVVNSLLASAVATAEIRVMSDGTPWRPLIHCRDIARTFVALLDAPADRIRGVTVNVGATRENYRVRDLVEAVHRQVPGAGVVYTGEVGHDPRNYRVDCGRLEGLLPAFRLRDSLTDGIRELHGKMVAHGFGRADFEGERFVRLRAAGRRLARLALDPLAEPGSARSA